MIVLPFTFRSIVGISIALILIVTIFMFRKSGGRESLDKRTGKLLELSNDISGVKNIHPGKTRYLIMDDYSYPFEIFIGKEWGDFKPDFEQIDKLKAGDSITVYFYEANTIRRDGINRHVKFIDKASVNYFQAGNSANYMLAIILNGICLLLIAYAYYLKRKGKLPY